MKGGALAWVGLLAAGCTSNTITVVGDGSGSTTAPPPPSSADGSDGVVDPCDDLDCGICGECSAGVCTNIPGCCEAAPGQPSQWRCSKPNCFDDSECGENQMCVGGICVDGVPPPVDVPTPCGDDIVFEFSMEELAVTLRHITRSPGVFDTLVGIDDAHQLYTITGLSPTGTLGDPLPGDQVFDLIDTRGAGAMVVMLTTDERGGPAYSVTRVNSTGTGIEHSTSEVLSGEPRDAIWGSWPADLLVLQSNGLDLWESDSPPLFDEQLSQDIDPGIDRIAPVAIAGHDVGWAGTASSDGSVGIVSTSNGTLMDSATGLVGTVIDLDASRDPAIFGWVQLLALTSVQDESGATWSSVTPIAIDPLDVQLPFGAEGVPTSMVVADLDSNGFDDIVVANADSRLDIYLRTETGVLCRGFSQLDTLVDLVAVDSDNNGQREVMFLDGFDRLFVIEGVSGT
ncbi:MAG: hypothetical protein AAF799_32995 [Myxococcota bacterium]